LQHVRAVVSTDALAGTGTLLTRTTGTAGPTTTVGPALLAVALRGTRLHTLVGTRIALHTGGATAAATAAAIVTALLGEAEDRALRLTPTPDALFVHRRTLTGKGCLEAEGLGVPAIAGLVDTVDQFLGNPREIAVWCTPEETLFKGQVRRTGLLHHAIHVFAAGLGPDRDTQVVLTDGTRRTGATTTTTAIGATLLAGATGFAAVTLSAALFPFVDAQLVPVVVAAEGVHRTDTCGDIGIIASGRFVNLAAIAVALARTTVFGTDRTGFPLVLLADTVATYNTGSTVLRAGLAGLPLALLAPAIAAIVGGILAQTIAATNLPIRALAARATTTIGATLLVGALGHANALAQVIAN
jgi:hypothetical protein